MALCRVAMRSTVVVSILFKVIIVEENEATSCFVRACSSMTLLCLVRSSCVWIAELALADARDIHVPSLS